MVRRQIYEVLKRQQASDVLDVEKLIFFEKSKDRGDGIKVRFLAEYLRDVAPFCIGKEAKRESGWFVLPNAPKFP